MPDGAAGCSGPSSFPLCILQSRLAHLGGGFHLLGTGMDPRLKCLPGTISARAEACTATSFSVFCCIPSLPPPEMLETPSSPGRSSFPKGMRGSDLINEIRDWPQPEAAQGLVRQAHGIHPFTPSGLPLHTIAPGPQKMGTRREAPSVLRMKREPPHHAQNPAPLTTGPAATVPLSLAAMTRLSFLSRNLSL